MKGKVLFALGVGVGYVLGSAAGRERYEKLKGQAKSVWQSDAVQERVTAAEDRLGEAVREQGAQVAEKISDTVKQTFAGQDSEPVSSPADPPEASSTESDGTESDGTDHEQH